jgi:hypothetical protein
VWRLFVPVSMGDTGDGLGWFANHVIGSAFHVDGLARGVSATRALAVTTDWRPLVSSTCFVSSRGVLCLFQVDFQPGREFGCLIDDRVPQLLTD